MRHAGTGRQTDHVVGVCDVGSFSALILIARFDGRLSQALLEEAHTIDLWHGSPDRLRITEQAVRRMTRVLRRFDQLVKHYGCDVAAIAGTAALRTAQNRDHVLRGLRKASSQPITVLPASKEAALASVGARSGLTAKMQNAWMVDIGGGSTEVVGTGPNAIQSLKVGAAVATEQWQGHAPRAIADRVEYFRTRAAQAMSRIRVPRLRSGVRLIGVGGTIVTLAALRNGLPNPDLTSFHGQTIDADWIADTAQMLACLTNREISDLIPFNPARARVLTIGTFLWAGVLNRLSSRAVTVSVRGLRWGVAARIASTGRLSL